MSAGVDAQQSATAVTRPPAAAGRPATEQGTSGGLRRVLWWAIRVGLVATLLLLPWEGLLLVAIRNPGWRFRVTDVELAAALTFVAWLGSLAAERRRPRVPRGVLLALGALGVVIVLSTSFAGPNRELATQTTTRVVLGWALLLVAIDIVRRPRFGLVVVAALALTAASSALVGWTAALRGTMDGLFGAGRLYTVGGVARMAGTWDYPTVAAMAWTALLLTLLPIIAWRARGRARLVPIAAAGLCILFGASILMTLTRGAFLGLAAGLLVLLTVAVALRLRRLAVVSLAAAVLIAAGGSALYLRLPLPLERLTVDSDADLYGADYRVASGVGAVPGARLRIPVTVTNRGLSTWEPGGEVAWRLAALWVDPVTGAPMGDHQVVARLPGPVPPGASIALVASVVAPRAPGRHDLAWDMQQGDVMDFSERGVRVAITEVLVADPGPPAPGADRPATDGGARLVELYPEMIPVLDRTQLWTAALRLAQKHPLLGVGPGAFRRLYGPEIGLTRWDTQIHANDLYVELAATTGLLGLGAFLLLAIACLSHPVRGLARAARERRARRTEDRHPPGLRTLLVAGLLATSAAWFAHQVVDHFLWMSAMGLLFWVPLGVGVGLSGHLGSGTRGRTGVPGTPR